MSVRFDQLQALLRAATPLASCQSVLYFKPCADTKSPTIHTTARPSVWLSLFPIAKQLRCFRALLAMFGFAAYIERTAIANESSSYLHNCIILHNDVVVYYTKIWCFIIKGFLNEVYVLSRFRLTVFLYHKDVWNIFR